MKNEKRDTKYELVRLIGAIAITLSHIPCSKAPLPFNAYINNLNVILGGFGVNLFVIIGAWFLCEASFKLERVIRIVSQLVFYAVILNLFSYLLGTAISLKSFFSGFMFWFPFGYVVMIFVAPHVNRLSEKTRDLILLVGGSIATIVAITGIFYPQIAVVRLFAKGLFIGPVWFVYVLIFVKKCKGLLEKEKDSKCFMLGMFVFVLSFCIMYLVFAYTNTYSIRNIYSPVCLLAAFGFFVVITSLNIKQSPCINTIASVTFGTYLIQGHRLFKNYVWNAFDHVNLSETSNAFILINSIVVIALFVVGLIMDYLWNKIYAITIKKYILRRKICL